MYTPGALVTYMLFHSYIPLIHFRLLITLNTTTQSFYITFMLTSPVIYSK